MIRLIANNGYNIPGKATGAVACDDNCRSSTAEVFGRSTGAKHPQCPAQRRAVDPAGQGCLRPTVRHLSNHCPVQERNLQGRSGTVVHLQGSYLLVTTNRFTEKKNRIFLASEILFVFLVQTELFPTIFLLFQDDFENEDSDEDMDDG